MTDFLTILHQSIDPQQPKPKSEIMVKALLEAEKNSHTHKPKYEFSQLIGDWQLYFITGTKNSQKTLGKIIGSGFYLPPIVQVLISYQSQDNHPHQGRIKNLVKVGLVSFSIDGPCKFISKKNIIAFDFTYLNMIILGQNMYQTNIRNGRESEGKFYQQNISKLAFFSYFLVTDNLMAARGRGGGLALWKKKIND